MLLQGEEWCPHTYVYMYAVYMCVSLELYQLKIF